MADSDPFAKYENAFQSIIPPEGTVAPVQNTGQVAIDPGLSRYNRFLIDQGVNPNTIGTALMDRDTGQMIVPTIAQEYRAINMNNQANAAHAKLLRAQHMAWQDRRPADALANYVRAQDLNAKRGESDYISRLQYFLEPILRANLPPPSANGFADI